MSECDICAELAEIKATLADHGDKLSILLTGVGKLVDALPAFSVDAVTFDGSDYLTRGAALTGESDASSAIVSFWVRSADTNNQDIIINATGSFFVYLTNTDGFVSVLGYDSAYTNGMYATGTTSIIDNLWHHVAVTFNAASSEIKIFIDGVDEGVTTNVDGTPGTLHFSDTDWAVGAETIGATFLTGDLAELYFAPGQYLDLSVGANLAKFIAGGKPVSLGADGSTPTGTAPAIYLHIDDAEAAANFATNAGTGGNFTVNGTLTTAGTSPSD